MFISHVHPQRVSEPSTSPFEPSETGRSEQEFHISQPGCLLCSGGIKTTARAWPESTQAPTAAQAGSPANFPIKKVSGAQAEGMTFLCFLSCFCRLGLHNPGHQSDGPLWMPWIIGQTLGLHTLGSGRLLGQTGSWVAQPMH